MPRVGKIAKWDDERGYGFITPHEGGRQVFFHISSLAKGLKRPLGGEVVSYELAYDENDRPQALYVAYIGVAASSSEKVALSPAALAAGAVGLVVVLITLQRTPSYALAYPVMSVLSFINYAADKSAANKADWRISERALLLVDLLCGWPGGLLAQQTLRHKTRKASFQVMFWVTVVANVAAVALIATALSQA